MRETRWPEEVAMTGLKDLMREYERQRFPAERRLDVHGEGPRVARDRTLHWIQSRAHEAPGQELLVIVERGGRVGQRQSRVAAEIQKLLRELEGRLIDGWQLFTPGTLAIRLSLEPRMHPGPVRVAEVIRGEGRTEETAGSARPRPADDIPSDLLDRAQRAAELRMEREGLSTRLLEVVLREIWIEVQALAMEHRVTFEVAMDRIGEMERRRWLIG